MGARNADRSLIVKLLVEIERTPGWRVRRGEKSLHTTVYPPNMASIIAVASTPSDYRWRKNLRAQLRQAGWTGTLLD